MVLFGCSLDRTLDDGFRKGWRYIEEEKLAEQERLRAAPRKTQEEGTTDWGVQAVVDEDQFETYENRVDSEGGSVSLEAKDIEEGDEEEDEDEGEDGGILRSALVDEDVKRVKKKNKRRKGRR